MSDSTLYLYTSLTAGSSHIITATSRIETILKANKIPFRAIDCATDDKARMLWGRRSKGRKIPGLVKYGSVIGDLDQIEEWNEFGELKDQINDVQDIFGEAPAPSRISEAQATAEAEASAARQRSSQPTSRSASESRHISISEPRDTQKEAESLSSTKKDDTPLAMAMRQAGAEAAAKAGQKKTSSISGAKPPPTTKDATDPATPAPVIGGSLGSTLNAQSQEPSPENTGAKAPAQLAAEGAPRTSVDKVADVEAVTDSFPGKLLVPSDAEGSETKSNEEQMLELRRKSSVTRTGSALSTSMSISEMDDPAKPRAGQVPTQMHRHRSLSAASPDEVKKAEDENRIVEESGEEDEGTSKAANMSKTKVGATDQAEQKVLKGTETQEQGAKDVDAAGLSVGD